MDMKTTLPTAAGVTDRRYFDALANGVCRAAAGIDRTSLQLKAEDSHFIRFNHGRVRQATQVMQAVATLAVVRGARRIEGSCTLSGDAAADVASLLARRQALAADLDELDDDPYLLLPDDLSCSERVESGDLPTPAEVVQAVASAAAGLDFVGFYAGGPVARGFADSRGQRHWHRVESFHVDWCLYHSTDKALKSFYAGSHWQADEFARRVAEGALRLPLLALPARRLEPGAYRAWFEPAAMVELLGTLAWTGFSAKSRHTGTSSLGRLASGEARLHADVSLSEDTGRGLAPAFTAEGFARPGEVALVRGGLAGDTLNSPRSAREYGLPANGATPLEMAESLSLAPGTLAPGDALAALDHGIWVANLWYLNYSDRSACRMTGMTRSACFVVEAGRLVAPLAVMRFDDSFLRMFGSGLLGLGAQAEQVPDNGTYKERQLASVTTPGALVDGWRLTL